MADENLTNQTTEEQEEEKEEKELLRPSFDIMYTIEITDLQDLTKSRYTPAQLYGFQETKRTMTWNKNILYPSRFSSTDEFLTDRLAYLTGELSNASEDNMSLVYNDRLFKDDFYAFYFDVAIRCIYIVHISVVEDEEGNKENIIDIKVYRRLDRRIDLTNGSTCSLALLDGCEYYFSSSLTTLTLTYPDVPHFECWMLVQGGSSGCTINFPAGTTYANGDKPEIDAGERYEISIKDGIVIAIMNEEES